MIKNIFFFCISLLIILALGTTHTWLAWHTFEWNGDTSVMALMDMGGWHPVIISLMLKAAYFFTGYHLYTFLLLQIIPFYLSLFIFIWAIYSKWRSVWTLALLLPFFTIQFYTMPIQLMSSSFSMVWIMLFYSMVLYGVLNPNFKHKWTKITFYIVTGILFIIALLSRHNAIIMVWPMTIVWIGMSLNKENLKYWSYLWRLGLGSFFSGIICLVLLIGINKALTHSDLGGVYPANSTILAQITGSCIMNMDEECFEESWWSKKWKEDPQRMENLKRLYYNTPTSGDALCASWRPDTPFLYHHKLYGLYEKWFYAVKMHTNNFYDHLHRYYEAIWYMDWNQKKILKESKFQPRLFEEFSHYARALSEREKAIRHEDVLKFNLGELKFRWGEKELKVAEFLSKYLLLPKTIWAVATNFVLFFIALVSWLIWRKNNLILYFLAISMAGVLSNIFVPLFTPAVWLRYTYPFFICATIGFCLFVVLLCLQLPYLKKFIVKRVKNEK